VNKPIKQHYVPKVYLTNFCDPMLKNKHLHVFDKNDKRYFNAHINDIGFSKNTYTIESPGYEYFYEYLYNKQYDSKMNGLINKLSVLATVGNFDVPILHDSFRTEVADMLFGQLMRTPKAYDTFLTSGYINANKTLLDFRRALSSSISDNQKELLDRLAITDDYIKSNVLKLVNEPARIQKLTNYIKKKTWILYYNSISSTNPFITSDHPVCYFNFATKSTGFDDNGLGVQTTAIFYPITPKILIAIYPNQCLFDEIKLVDGQKFIADDSSFVNTMNDLQYRQCKRQIYSSMEYIPKNI
jgi:hypothetical protein